jgi:hypothetical protein
MPIHLDQLEIKDKFKIVLFSLIVTIKIIWLRIDKFIFKITWFIKIFIIYGY